MNGDTAPTRWILHVDLDAFFAAVEQLDKPSARSQPVIVGGTGPRGVVATASYEARRFGVHSALPMSQARRLCPKAFVLAPRFDRYRGLSTVVMDVLSRWSPLVEPVSLDEAFVDLTAGRALPEPAAVGDDPRAIAQAIRERIHRATGLTASVGIGRTKIVAKLASDAAKPDGLLVVTADDEVGFLHPMPVERIWGVGPATTQKLHRIGIRTAGDIAHADVTALAAAIGANAARHLHELAWGRDSRAVVAHREAKSVSAETTFPTDVHSPADLADDLSRQSGRVAARIAELGLGARTVTVKVRFANFQTITRSGTLTSATDDAGVITTTARALLAGVDVTGGVRLLGVGVSGLSEATQSVLPIFDAPAAPAPPQQATHRERVTVDDLRPGMDVTHPVYGPGWVCGFDGTWVQVRFETAETGPGRTRTFDAHLVPLTHRMWAPPT